MGGAGKIAVDGGEAQNAGGLRRVPVELIAARNANVGHPLPPQFGCHDIKMALHNAATMPQVSQERPFVKAFAGNRKAPGSLRRKPLPMRMLWKLEAAGVRMLDACQTVDTNPTNRAAYSYSERASLR
jgi:hypothetical protein